MAKEAGGAEAAGGEEMLVQLEADVASWLREACLALLDGRLEDSWEEQWMESVQIANSGKEHTTELWFAFEKN